MALSSPRLHHFPLRTNVRSLPLAFGPRILDIWSTPRRLSCRHGSGSGIAGKIAHGPAHHVHPHLLDVGPFPDLLTMPKPVVKNTPFAVLAGPDDREVL